MAERRGMLGGGRQLNEVQEGAMLLLMAHEIFQAREQSKALRGEVDDIDIEDFDGDIDEVELVIRDDFSAGDIMSMMSRINTQLPG